jgi:hypothetical protein
MERRTFLKGAVIAASAPAAALAPEIPAIREIDINKFLAKATPAEIIRYHSNALMEALSIQRPDLHWATLMGIDLDHVLVVDKARQAPSGAKSIA